MRVLEEIIHPSCKITIFQWNGKYIIKIEQGLLEQSYKVDETDFMDLSEVKAILTEEFIQSTLKRFHAMHMDLSKVLDQF